MSLIKRKTKGEAVFDIINNLGMLLICFVTLYPIWYVLINAFNDGKDAMLGGIYWWPRVFSLENFKAVFDNPGITTAMLLTVAKTLVGVGAHVFFTAMVAYAFSRRELIFGRFYIFLGTITMIFSGGLIPTYLLIRDLHMLDTFAVFIIPVLFSFFDLIIFMTFFREIPDGLDEAARIDGANDWTILLRIVLPVSMPVIATIALFHGVYQWNDYFAGIIYINKESLQPIQTFLYRVVAQSSSNIMTTALQGSAVTKTVTSQSVKLATMVVTTLPIVFAYPFLQRYFVKGMMIGSIKG
ncbi:carbohydrate ABC transporter permease [Paenibacillus motobuensis]|uniref:carbohydrate ABC transporter permease n=1 Tax=Paenibacillus TaxID=44249 RepID=UPI00203C4E59|nr:MULTISPECIES: carbohydrate ABC transporter permease [Paenibacillus]MCM3041671.1 carbohydrate ABC transporter permease [Paenibacillus lutimineralis]MCM3648775.1 carbohydrate ABC transporter permease [Paenibacillus motobuensis]